MRFYNNTLKGLPSAISMIVKAAAKRVYRKLHSRIHSWNLKRCGRNINIGIGTYFPSPLSVSLGDNVSIADYCRVINDEIPTGELVIHDNVSIDRDCLIDYSGGLTIASNTHISFGVWISTHNHGADPHSIPSPCHLNIGKNVWIGAKAIILPQCNFIGDNAIVGAGAVVTKDVPQGAKIVGNTGRIIPS